MEHGTPLTALPLASQCDEGWFGLDCSIPAAGVPADAAPPPWLLSPRDGVADPGTGDQPNSMGEWQALTQVPRQRPYVYVYDMPPEFTFQHIEVRYAMGTSPCVLTFGALFAGCTDTHLHFDSESFSAGLDCMIE